MPPSEASPVPRARVRRRSLRTRSVVLLALLLGALLAAGVFGHRAYWQRHTELHFVADGVTLPTELELTFFPDRLAFAQPSPPPPLGHMTWRGEALVLGSEQVPGSAVVRYTGVGVGSGVAHVQLGQPRTVVRLRPATELRGRVGAPIASWNFGWRCLGMVPLADAEVVVMAGGEHGIDLATVRTGADGAFVVAGLDRTREALAVRVRAPGHAIAHEPLPRDAGTEVVVMVDRGSRCRGRVVLPAGLAPTELRVLVRGLPGVEAAVGADGAFTLEHLPAQVQARLLVHGLPPTAAQAPVRVRDGDDVRIDVVVGALVRGRVRELLSRTPLAGALVFRDDGDAVRTDADGYFELPQQLPGTATLTAQYEQVDARRRRTRLLGTRELQLAAGAVVDDVELLVTRSP